MNTLKDEETLFAAALRLPGAERRAYLDRACAGDPLLRRRLEALLKSYAASEEVLEKSAAPDLDRALAASNSLNEQAGGCIGRYKLLQQIGEGGCGVVYMAEQEEPVRRRVALKVIKLGMDTRQVIARFEAERQALAMMDHPNIAKVLDAGATQTGRPYFVMELVRGIKITDYCDEKRLSTGARLELFIQVCHAIQHAHQKGVIHRDIKPSNILVTINDGVAVPKVIDFGIAKATNGQQLTDKTIFTAFEQFIGTPAYMSPEQTLLTSLDIDTRSDIYALGVLLYELLTGKTPFDSNQLLAIGLDEMRRTIREQEPERPSTCLSTLSHEELSTTAQRRGLEAPNLVSQLRGDLDWIVMKCLEKDRRLRYETANDLAMDIRRHLRSEPVLAFPPSAAYRFRKSVRRNKVAFAAAVGVTAALMVGLSIASWSLMQERRARREQSRLRQVAEREKTGAQQISQFFKDMLRSVGPSVALGRDTALLREILENTATGISRHLPQDPEIEAALRNTIGEVFFDLGDYQKAERMHRVALQIRRQIRPQDNISTTESLHNLAKTLLALSKLSDAESCEREALKLRRASFGEEHREVAASISMLGKILFSQGKRAEAESTHRAALAMRLRLFGPKDRTVADSLGDLAAVLAAQSRLSEAESTYCESLSIIREAVGEAHPDLIPTLASLAGVLIQQEKLEQGEGLYREILSLTRQFLGEAHPRTDECVKRLITVLRNQHKLVETEALCRQDLALAEQQWGAGNPRLVLKMGRLASVLRVENKANEAAELGERALELTRDFTTLDPISAEDLKAGLAGLAHEDKDYPKEEFLLRDLLDSTQPDETQNALRREQWLDALAGCLAAQNKKKEAEESYRAALSSARAYATNDLPRLEKRLNQLADCLQEQGKLAEAKALYVETLDLKRKRVGNDARDVGLLLRALGYVYERQQDLSQAERAFRDSLTIARATAGKDNPQDATWSLYGLAWVLNKQGKLGQAETMAREAFELRKTLKLRQEDRLVIADSLYQLAVVLWCEKKLDEAERRARECIEIYANREPTGWQIFNAKSTLAGILMAAQKYGEAERLLGLAYEGLKDPAGAFPAAVKPRARETVQRLIELYDLTARPELAASWKSKLAEIDGQVPVPRLQSSAALVRPQSSDSQNLSRVP